MILSVDWDAFSGCREFVFDAPIWGSADRPFDRLARWHERCQKRGGLAGDGWQALEADFPLYDGWQALLQYRGVPAYVTLSHDDIWPLLKQQAGHKVLNIDSHHDLYSQSGPTQALRPSNWAGLALAQGLISQYECCYPDWHATLAVCEGYDLGRTRQEIAAAAPELTHSDIFLSRGLHWPSVHELQTLVLVQSPSWTSPNHDEVFADVAQKLAANVLQPPLPRSVSAAVDPIWG